MRIDRRRCLMTVSNSTRLIVVAFAIALFAVPVAVAGRDSQRNGAKLKDQPDNLVQIDVLAPRNGDSVGKAGIGWIVDLQLRFQTNLEATGFTAPQLTGPAGHNNIPPFPGLFKDGADDRLPGLIVLLSTAAKPGLNLAGLFNVTGIGDVDNDEVNIQDTWLVGSPAFAKGGVITLYVAVAADLNGDGIFNDAPDEVPDADGDGDVDQKDLRAFGVASQIAKVRFFIND
jgi:hypothetical protein